MKGIEGFDMMGNEVMSKLKFCGENIRLYPLCKIVRAENTELDNNCQIFDFVFIDAGESLKIGKYSTITWQTIIEGGGRTVIGDRVFIGPGSKILTSTLKLHGYYSVEHLPNDCWALEYGDIIIKDDAYVGASCTILPGITIGEGAVVGANSLVNKDLEAWGIYVGTPCKKIGERQKPTDERKKSIDKINWSKHL